MARACSGIVLCVCLLLSSTLQSEAQEPGAPSFSGALPRSGGVVLITLHHPIAVTTLVDDLGKRGCAAVSLTVSDRGILVTYIAGAPAFVNVHFPQQLSVVPLMVRCASAPPVTPASHLLTLVTPEHGLDPTFVPRDLVALPAHLSLASPIYLTMESGEALARMLDAAQSAGHRVVVRSAYRSYAEQRSTFQHWVSVMGEAEAQRRSARPGHSEHQLGTTVDLTSAAVNWGLTTAFAETPEGQWIAQNAWRFGFVESYPAGAEATTGYHYEPWHLRYIGEAHAEWLRRSGLTLTEYLTALHQESE